MTRLISFLAHAVYMGTPLLFGTVGEIQNEKAGHLNLGVEGTMAMGACAGFMVAYKTGSLWLSILAAFLMGALVSLIYAFLTIEQNAPPIPHIPPPIRTFMYLYFTTLIPTASATAGFSPIVLRLRPTLVFFR